MSNENGETPPTPQPKPDGKPGPKIKMSRNVVSWLILLGLAMVLVALLQQTFQAAVPISITEFDSLVKSNRVKELMIREDGSLELKRVPAEGDLPGKDHFKVEYPPGAIDKPFLDEVVLSVRDAGGKVIYQKQNQFVLLLVGMLPWILIFGFVWFFIFRQLRSAGGPGGMLGSFGRSRHRLTPKRAHRSHLHRCGRHRRSQGRSPGDHRVPAITEKVPASGRSHSARNPAGGRAGLRQDASRQGHRR